MVLVVTEHYIWVVVMWEMATNNEDCVPTFLYRLEKSTKVEITDDFWPASVGGIEIVPDCVYLADWEPMARRVANETLFVANVSAQQYLRS
jgi:hypothetical protein